MDPSAGPPGEPPSTGQPSTGQPSARQPSAGQPSAGQPKISLFFFSFLPPQFSFFFLSLGVLSWNFVGVFFFEGRNPEMCPFGLSGCRVKPRRPHQTGPPGLAHDSPRTPNVHILRAPALQTPPKFHETTPKREIRKKIVVGGGKKKARNFGPPPFRAPPFGAKPFWAPTLLGPTVLGLHPSRAHPSRAPLCRPKIQHPKIGRSRNWPKSKLAEVEIGRSRKKELSEVEIGRSRPPPTL